MGFLLVPESSVLIDLSLEDILDVAEEKCLDTVNVHFKQHKSSEATTPIERAPQLPPTMDYTFLTFTYKGYLEGEELLTSMPQFFGNLLYVKNNGTANERKKVEQYAFLNRIPGFKLLISKDPDMIIHEQIEARVKEIRDHGFESSAYIKKIDAPELMVIGPEQPIQHSNPQYRQWVIHW